MVESIIREMEDNSVVIGSDEQKERNKILDVMIFTMHYSNAIDMQLGEIYLDCLKDAFIQTHKGIFTKDNINEMICIINDIAKNGLYINGIDYIK